MTVYPGVDVLKFAGFEGLKGRRVGLLTHAAAADYLLTSTVDLLFGAPNVDLKALYSPEHGLSSAARDGEHVDDSLDPRTRLPVFSLYGPSPAPDMLDGIDLVVVDLVDVGTRFYTYIWTMTQMMEMCGERGVDMMVLDRPNPLGGRVRGLYTEPDATSLVGRYAHSLPLVHGLTIGEMARYFAAEHIPKPPKISVITVSDWRRDIMWPETGLPWLPTSPAMAHYSTVVHYPGGALTEGTTLSEGRGTTLPFEIAGAPGIDGHHLAERLNMQHLQGVRFRPHVFRPTASKHAGQDCEGVQAHITDMRYFDPLRVWLSVLVTIRAVYPDQFRWTEPVNGHSHFDRLIGNTWLRPMIDANARVDELLAEERDVIAHFEERRAPYLLYG
jgi:uncharacterized protein YbbC (DUF1343 family)